MSTLAHVERQQVESWTKLCELVSSYRDSGHFWIFRGVGNADYDLRPKIGRDDARKPRGGGPNLPYDRNQERRMIDYFIRSAPPYSDHTPQSRLEWLAVAQHHGMATRLLDWTESLLVAAFFAVKSAVGKGTTPAICAVMDVEFAPTEKHKDPDTLADVTLYYPPHISPRIPAQRSVFTVHKYPDRPYAPPGRLEKLLLDPDPVPFGRRPLDYRHYLDACGINNASLFPDINGLAQYVSWLYKWERLPGAAQVRTRRTTQGRKRGTKLRRAPG